MPLFFVIKQLNRGIQCFRRVPCLRNICADLLASDKARLVPTISMLVILCVAVKDSIAGVFGHP